MEDTVKDIQNLLKEEKSEREKMKKEIKDEIRIEFE